MLSADTILQNRYRIARQLGKGGMGAVYEAVDQRLSSIVAIKETLVTTDEARRAFEREASLLANLHHRALPHVTDHFAEADSQYLVMQFIPGEDLAQLLELRQRAFPVADVLRWADEILGAIEYLHSHTPPILHRDIKPANLKLSLEGGLFLIDFGLSKGKAGQMPTLLTSRSVKGYTLAYSPLEQIHGGGTDPRSDLYSVGATLYHLLTNVPPVDAPTRFNAYDDLQPDPLVPADQVNPEVSHGVAQVIGLAMAMNRRNRPESATEMRRMLREATQTIAPQVSANVPVVKPESTAEPRPTIAAEKDRLPPTPATEPFDENQQAPPHPTIQASPNLVERRDSYPAAVRVAPWPRMSTPALVLLISAAVMLVLVGGSAIVGALINRYNTEGTQRGTQPNPTPLDRGDAKPAETPPTRKSFAGDFNIGKALELAYGSYDYNKKYVKWKLTNEDKKNEALTGSGITESTVYGAPMLVQSFVENGVQRYLVLTESVPPHYDCHACAPIIGGATFSQQGSNWELDTSTKIITRAGSFGRPPSSKLLQIGAQEYAAELQWSYTAMGESDEGVTIIAEVNDTLREIFSAGTGGENSSACGDNSVDLSRPTPCWKFSSKMTFEPGSNPDYYDLKMTSRGTNEDDNGKIQRVNGTKTYRFTDGQYKLIQ